MSTATQEKKSRSAEAVKPPNLVPIMNLVTILIPFLLLSVTFVHLAVVDSSLPAISPGVTPDVESINLSVAITDRGFVVQGESPLLATEPEAEASPTIPRTADGKLDFQALSELMVHVKAAHPGEHNVILIPETQINYEEIVHTMDATREHLPEGAQARELLFPHVVIAGGVQ